MSIYLSKLLFLYVIQMQVSNNSLLSLFSFFFFFWFLFLSIIDTLTVHMKHKKEKKNVKSNIEYNKTGFRRIK